MGKKNPGKIWKDTGNMKPEQAVIMNNQSKISYIKK